MTRDVNKLLTDDQLLAFRCRAGDWPQAPRGTLPVPDDWIGLVIKPDGRRRLIPPGENPQPERDDILVLLRRRDWPVTLTVADVPASDRHLVSATIELCLRCPPRDHELAALRDTLLTEAELTVSRLSQAISHGGALAALRDFICRRQAAELVHQDQTNALMEHLRKALKPFLFVSGLSLERLGQVNFVSESLVASERLQQHTARQMQELAARQRLEEAALTATRRRLEALGDVLAKLQQVAAGQQSLRWHSLLPALTIGERARLLENLWRITPDRLVAAAFVVIAGQECLWLDPAEPRRISKRVRLPDTLGGLRSVNFDRATNSLLVGAAGGVWRLHADGEVAGEYPTGTKDQPRTGFNAATISAGRLLATHSQLGAWLWDVDRPNEAMLLLAPAAGTPRTIRAATADPQGQLLLAADNRVCAFRPSGEATWEVSLPTNSVHCLTLLEDRIYVGTSDGQVLRLDAGRPGNWLVVHRGSGAIESINARRWDDLVELVIPAGRQGVCGLYCEEGIVAPLMECPVAIRRAWASDDAMLGLAETRDTLFVLHGSLPARSGCPLPLARQVGALIQDACIVTQAADISRSNS